MIDGKYEYSIYYTSSGLDERAWCHLKLIIFMDHVTIAKSAQHASTVYRRIYALDMVLL